MKAKRLSELVLEVRVPFGGVDRFLLLSDIHFDHPYCDRKRFFRVMDEAKDMGAQVLFNGDFFCMMQGRMDKRGSKDKIRDEHKGPNYFNLVIDEAAELLTPYVDNILFMGDGNHETSILKWNEINPLDMLVTILQHKTKTKIHRGGYHGFIRLRYHREGNNSVRTKVIYHHHGKYGGAVTMGVLGVKRHAAIIPDADVIWTGHTHDLWHVTHPVLKVTQSGKVKTVQQHHVKTGTFKDEFNRPGGFGVERLNKPAAIGGYWMKTKISGPSEDLVLGFQQATGF